MSIYYSKFKKILQGSEGAVILRPRSGRKDPLFMRFLVVDPYPDAMLRTGLSPSAPPQDDTPFKALYNQTMPESRGMQLGGDLDNLAYAKAEEFDAALKKFCATKNCKPDTAMRWALQRSLSEEQRKFIQGKFDELYKSGATLI